MKTPDFEKIYLLCRKFLRPPVDAENVAAEIVLESLEKGKYVTYFLIRARCYDELRKFRKEESFRRLELTSYLRAAERDKLSASDEAFHDGSCFNSVQLSREEREVLYLKFYRNFSHAEIGVKMGVQKYRVSLLVSSLMEKLKESRSTDD